MNEFLFFYIFWLIIQIININYVKKFKSRDLKFSQNLSGLINCIILIIFFLYFRKNINYKFNIIIFITYYLTDLLYYFIFFSTDIDIEYEQNIDEDKKKKIIFDRYKYVIHHIIALTLLYTAYKNKNNHIIIKYTNIFIFLLELPTFFLCLNYILKQTGKIKILFMV